MQVSAILAFRLTAQAPERLARFYQGLGFSRAGPPMPIPAEEIALLKLKGGGTRIALRLGRQRLEIDGFDEPGKPYPSDSTAADLWFQHFAIVTERASAAWEQAKGLGAQAISWNGAVTLPPSSGGVTAVKFRDPEGHPLELLQFPRDNDRGWKGEGLLGIDHSAIGVSGAQASARFYETLGLTVRGQTLNTGPEQDALDGLPGVQVDVVPMTPPAHAPHLELLCYRSPRGRACAALHANDVAATRIVWAADREMLLRDPDGHLHLLKSDRARRALPEMPTAQEHA